jgi:hypothetical protein
MKKTLVFGAATAAVALSLGSCVMVSCVPQPVPSLYGPPPMQEDDDPIEDVYGSPVDFDEETDSNDTDDHDDGTDIDDAEPAEPEDDEGMMITLYGPPPTDMD